MENISLQELQFFLEEDLFLLPEDKNSIKSKTSISSKVEPISESNNTLNEDLGSYNSETTHQQADPIPVQGNFTKGLLVVHEEQELSEEVMDMLVKMINAVGRSMNEVGLVSSPVLEGRTLEEFQALNAHIILKFGRIKHPINAVPAIPYEVFTDDETQYLFADALSQISEDKGMKRQLWNALQVLFNIKK
ncbi:hypothetical protein [Algoriphagus sp.]|uniref:hypothetical protein n=1 Tax=Algoriphagus sp. TaxID=1872435 RepID=UPI0025F1A17C|nr:hypothetical protein [Algoriphagus sp.]